MAGPTEPSKVILDPSIVFSDEALDWIADPELRPWLAVSQALMRRLEDAQTGEEFMPYAHPDPERIDVLREALRANEIKVFSVYDVIEKGTLSREAREICEHLADGNEPLGDVLADEWAFLTTQSLALIRGIARHALPAFGRAGGKVIEITAETMQKVLDAVREHIPDPVLNVMKRVDPAINRIPDWLLLGGEIAGYAVPHLGLGLAIATSVERGVVVIAGDP